MPRATTSALSSFSTTGSGVAEAVGDATTTGFPTATPLFQTSFLPELTQVNFFPPLLFITPAFEHVAPALTAPNAGIIETDPSRAAAITSVNTFFMAQSLP
jgi:hypothetical protein